MSGRPIDLVAADGYRLAATLFASGEVDGPAPTVVLHGATAVARRFYARIAGHLASRGFRVLTFDYRGIGGSLHGPVAELDATMMDWATLDAPAARKAGAELAAGGELYVFTHSFGGQAIAIAPPREPVSAAVFVGSQLGDVRTWPWRLRPWFFFGVGVMIPLCCRLFGYVPGWAGFGEDLPGGVAREWARWCRTRGYVFGVHPELADAGRAVRFPILALSLDDDHYAPRRAVRLLLERFPSADVEHRHLVPDERGVPSIGHFGYFRSSRSELWAEPADWLAARAATG